MRSKIYSGFIDHTRCEPIVHRFRYPMCCYGFDVDELSELDRTIPFFGHNRFNFLSLHDDEYLPGYSGTLRERVEAVAREHGAKGEFAHIELITNPKVCNYIFNPVSFYRCFDEHDALVTFIAEVNNTFGETHLYVLNTPDEKKNSYYKYSSCKEFHVSPFNDRSGVYLFYVLDSESRLDIRVNIEKKNTVVFTTQLRGEAEMVNSQSVARAILRYPFSALLAMPRIMLHAATLWAGKRMPVFTKPIADSSNTIVKVGPGWLQRLSLRLCLAFFEKIQRGHLRLVLADGQHYEFGTPGEEPQAEIRIANYDFFVRCAFSGDIGFGESYVDGQWECDDLVALCRLFLVNMDTADDRSLWSTKVIRACNWLGHLLRNNSLRGSKNNIRAHYDLSNELFSLFLDDTMMYSAAKFEHQQQSLYDAQMNKITSLIKKAEIRADDHVLEIGCGWGAFAIEAAKQTGCRVTGITLSQEQHALATARVEQAGLSDRVSIQLCDYRNVTGTFDKIVSVEMIEAVGHKYLGEFFAQCERLLAKDGLMALQVITFPDSRYEAYRKGCDWIQKYIFPGGLCPSVAALTHAMSVRSHFVLESAENIGQHYAETLKRWRQRFFDKIVNVEALGFDTRFIRMWEYYLCYCEAGFLNGTLGTHHLVFRREGNAVVGGIPELPDAEAQE